MNYTVAIRQLERQITERTEGFEEEMRPLKAALETLRNANTACLACYGDGTVRRPDAAGQMESIECPKCKGKGEGEE